MSSVRRNEWPQMHKSAIEDIMRPGNPKTEEEIWPHYGTPMAEYSAAFKPLLPEGDIKSFLESRRQAGKPTLALDLFSGPEALQSVSKEINGGLAVGLAHDRQNFLRPCFSDRHIFTMSADLTSQRTWRSVNSWVQTQEFSPVKAFDLIVDFAEGGYELVPQNLNIYYALLNDAYKVCSSDHGTMLLQIPTEAFAFPEVQQFFQLLEQTPGIIFKRAGRTIRIDRLPESPDELPKLI